MQKQMKWMLSYSVFLTTVASAIEAALQKLAQEKSNTAAAEADALRQTGFASRQAALDALAPIGDADGAQWLAHEREALTSYQTEVKTLRDRVAEQEAAAEGLQRVDLAALETEKQIGRAHV